MLFYNSMSFLHLQNLLISNSADKPNVLIILSEKELVTIDLSADDWAVLRLPYLCTVGSSAVQAVHLEENVPLPLWERLVTAGKVSSVNFSARVSFPTNCVCLKFHNFSFFVY